MKIIGIDLGTTNSLAAVWKDGESVLIPNAFGKYLTPSVVSAEPKGDTMYVGQVASERLITDPPLTAAAFKRFMGTRKEYHLGKRTFSPEELSALVLKRLKEDAESYLGEAVEEAVISVPAYFNDAARKATKQAGELAGLQVNRIINEPSAAALACQHLKAHEDALILVFDMGGGTLDVSLVECFDNIINILAVSGDNHLGGRDFDEALARHFCRERNYDWTSIADETKAVLLESANRCKQALSESSQAEMVVQCREIRESMTVDREMLIESASEVFVKLERPIRSVLSDAHINVSELTDVVLVGGSCNMPVVQQYLQYLLKRKEIEVMNPDHLIALGMGVYAGVKERNEDIKDMLLTDICPFSLGTGVHNKSDPERQLMSVLIERNTALPASREGTYYTVHNNQEQIRFSIYQGEQFYAEDNLMLGELIVKIPPAPAGEIAANIRFTYDINGVLEVNVFVPKTNEKKKLVVVNEAIHLSDEEVHKKLEEFRHLKVHPRDKEENRLRTAKGEQLYARATGELREEIGQRLQFFQYLLQQQDTYKIQKWGKYVDEFLGHCEKYLDTSVPSGDMNVYTENWYERNPEDTVIENFEEWRRKNDK